MPVPALVAEGGASRADPAFSPEAAAELRELMTAAVETGTGKAAKIDGVLVGAKTGTAQHALDEAADGRFLGWAAGPDGS